MNKYPKNLGNLALERERALGVVTTKKFYPAVVWRKIAKDMAELALYYMELVEDANKEEQGM